MDIFFSFSKENFILQIQHSYNILFIIFRTTKRIYFKRVHLIDIQRIKT